MDTDIKKWLVRAGALLILLGFVLPVMTTSCSGLVNVSQNYSLAEIASLPGNSQSLLYLVPIGTLITLTLAFIPVIKKEKEWQFLLGQLGGIAAGILGIFLTAFSLSDDLQEARQFGIFVNLELGFYLLILGYVATGIGLVLRLKEVEGSLGSELKYQSENFAGYRQGFPFPPPARGQTNVPQQGLAIPMLQVDKGNLPQVDYILSDHFTIGRSRNNDLRLTDDPSISRSHAVIRFAGGSWFIQDQDSGIGVFVNGEHQRAARLTHGDLIKIGSYIFKFIEPRI